jgi:hypothetical protein
MESSLPSTIYVTFAGSIDQQSLPRIFSNLAAATQRGVSCGAVKKNFRNASFQNWSGIGTLAHLGGS